MDAVDVNFDYLKVIRHTLIYLANANGPPQLQAEQWEAPKDVDTTHENQFDLLMEFQLLMHKLNYPMAPTLEQETSRQARAREILKHREVLRTLLCQPHLGPLKMLHLLLNLLAEFRRRMRPPVDEVPIKNLAFGALIETLVPAHPQLATGPVLIFVGRSGHLAVTILLLLSVNSARFIFAGGTLQ